MKARWIPVLLSCSMAGCELAVNVPLEGDRAVLTVESYAVAGDAWTSVVGISTPIGDESSQPAWDEISVLAEDGAGREIPFHHRGGGFFVADGERPVGGSSYRLTAFAPGYAQVEADLVIPGPVSDAHLEEAGSDGGWRLLRLSFVDANAGADYYSFTLLDDRFVATIPVGFVDAPFLDELQELSAPDLFSPGAGDRQYTEALFSDKDFDGRGIELTLRIPQFASPEVTGILEHVSADKFAYRRGVLHQLAVGNNPFLEPVRIPGNVRGGYGVVGGASVTYLGTATAEFQRQLVAGSYVLESYEVTEDGLSRDFAASGDIEASLELGREFRSVGELSFSSRLTGTPGTISLEGGYDVHLGAVRLYLNARTLLGTTEFHFDRSSGVLSGSSGTGPTRRVYVAFRQVAKRP